MLCWLMISLCNNEGPQAVTSHHCRPNTLAGPSQRGLIIITTAMYAILRDFFFFKIYISKVRSPSLIKLNFYKSILYKSSIMHDSRFHLNASLEILLLCAVTHRVAVGMMALIEQRTDTISSEVAS